MMLSKPKGYKEEDVQALLSNADSEELVKSIHDIVIINASATAPPLKENIRFLCLNCGLNENLAINVITNTTITVATTIGYLS